MIVVATPTQNITRPVRPRWVDAICRALILCGVVLRVARWMHWRSLWLDEIFLANSILQRSWHDLLLKSLGDWQAAPPGFLILARVAVAVFGHGERALRLPSLVFGLASLPLMAAVARRALPLRAAVVALAFFVFLGPLIYYSNELKQYSCDVAVSLAIVLSVLRLLEQPSRRRLWTATAVGGVGIFFSYPAVFVLAGMWAVVVWRAWHGERNDAAPTSILPRSTVRRGSPQASGGGKSGPGNLAHAMILSCVILLIAEGIEYLVFVRPVANGEAHPHLVWYWAVRDGFMPISPLKAVCWLFPSFWRICQSPGAMWLAYPDAAMVALIVGLAVAMRRGILLLILAPLPLVLAASAMKQYPLADRLALFFVPVLLVVMAAGIDALCENWAGIVAAFVLGGMILVPSAVRATGYLFVPPGREESLEAYQWTAEHWRPGDVLYLSRFARFSYDYYKSAAGWPVDPDVGESLRVQPPATEPGEILADARRLAGHKRVWVIMIHTGGGAFDEEPFTLAECDQIGRRILSYQQEAGVDIFLYDCALPPGGDMRP